MDKKVTTHLKINEERHKNRLSSRTFVHLQDSSRQSIKDFQVHVSSSVYDFGSVSPEDIIMGNILLQNQEIPFVQLKTTTNISSALKLMIKTWNIYAPQAVLVLRSDLCFLTSENEIKLGDKLAQSIIKAAFNVHRMWMCTHGLNIGFSKIIGKAFNEANVTNRVHHLEKDSDLLLHTTESALIGICEKNVYNNSIQQCQKFKNDLICYDEVDLNPYHSHFIFVTDEVRPAMNYDYFFSKFECGLKDYQPPILSMKPKVPVIALLVGGKETCIDYLLLHMQQCLPVLVIYGSGGFADIVAFAYFEISRSGLRTTDSEYHENLLKPILCRKICVAFPHLNEKLYDYLVDNIFKCIYNLEKETSEYLYILDAHGHSMELERLSYHMLCALFKSQRKNIVQWHLQMKSDLLLTIDWNCPDVALSEVFLMYPKFTVTSSIFESVLFTKDREAFVSLFFQRGFKLHNFLSSNQLISILQKSKKEKFFYDVCWKGFLHCEEVFDINAEFIDVVLNSFIYCLTNLPFHISSEELDLNAIGIYSTKLEKHEESILAEQKAISLLIVWALISNRIKLAHVLLHFTGMPVMTAFICSIILNHLLPFVTDVSMRSTISMESKRFCEIANGVFSKAYDVAPAQTWKKLAVKNPIWGDYTLAQVALMVQNYDFLSQECFQKWTTHMYMGRIRMIELPRYWFKVPVCLKVMLSAIFIAPIYFWISFEHKPILSEKSVSNVNSEGYSQETATKNNFQKLSDMPSSAEQPHKIEATPSKSYLQNLSLWNMIMIMWTTPITKFWTSYILYILFLTFFCFTTIWPACNRRFMDLGLAIWIASIIIEKIHCFYSSQMIYSRSMSFLKRIEIVYMCIFIFFILVDHVHKESFQSYSHKVIHCFGLLFFFYRIMYTYMPMFFALGPLMYRFKVIVFVEAMHYMCLIFFVMISNGIVVETLLHPDYPYTMELLRRAIQRGWIQLFISIPYKVAKNQVRCLGWEKQPLNGTECRVRNNYDYDCPYVDYWSYFFILHYMIIAKLVFWPLFFAFVNYANSKLATESEQHWNAYRYLLISEYAYSRPLPAPFNLFYYILYALKYVFCVCCHQMSKCNCWNKKNKNEQSMILKPFSFGHHSFWKQVFFEYIDEQQDSQKGSQYSKNKLNMISEFQEGVKYQEKTIYKAKSQVAELEADVTYTRLFAQTSKYWVEQDKVQSFSIHVLSRCSPYHGTNIERYPVPDKYVPWDVKWLNYEPTMYTASNSEFPEHLQWFADINIFRSDLPEDCSEFHERYEMRWNMNYTDSHGVYKRRKSWIKHNDHNLIYMLYHGMPQNPQGRTGLSGKGFLLQWGPNHYVYLIITRFKKLHVNDQVEFVAVNVRNVLSLPGGFARSRNRYMAVRDFFTADWETETDMKEFFESCIIKSNDDDDDSELVECKMIKKGYMDNPLNTDNAWKEVELWHVHYKAPTNVNVYFKPDLFWCTVDEKLFRKLPQGQFYLLKLVLRRLDIIREHD